MGLFVFWKNASALVVILLLMGLMARLAYLVRTEDQSWSLRWCQFWMGLVTALLTFFAVITMRCFILHEQDGPLYSLSRPLKTGLWVGSGVLVAAIGAVCLVLISTRGSVTARYHAARPKYIP